MAHEPRAPETERPPPWERQPGEPPRAYAAFCIYRDLPPAERSVRAVAERLGIKGAAKGQVPGHMLRWSTRWRWVERARAWDAELDRQAREARVLAVKEMQARHAAQARKLQEKALKRLEGMDLSEMGPMDVLRFIIEAAKLERLALGEPETVGAQEVRATGNVIIYLPDNGRRRSDGGSESDPA